MLLEGNYKIYLKLIKEKTKSLQNNMILLNNALKSPGTIVQIQETRCSNPFYL